jgi:hypothetical protein
MVRATLDLAPFCPAEPVPCDDGDACTTGDVCDGTCHGTVAGVTGARCLLDGLASPTACADTLPRALRRQVARRVKKTRALVASWERKAAHGASAGVLAKVRKAADRNLAALDKAIDAASHAKPSRAIGAECSATLRSFVARERDVLAHLGA